MIVVAMSLPLLNQDTTGSPKETEHSLGSDSTETEAILDGAQGTNLGPGVAIDRSPNLEAKGDDADVGDGTDVAALNVSGGDDSNLGYLCNIMYDGSIREVPSQFYSAVKATSHLSLKESMEALFPVGQVFPDQKYLLMLLDAFTPTRGFQMVTNVNNILVCHRFGTHQYTPSTKSKSRLNNTGLILQR